MAQEARDSDSDTQASAQRDRLSQQESGAVTTRVNQSRDRAVQAEQDRAARAAARRGGAGGGSSAPPRTAPVAPGAAARCRPIRGWSMRGGGPPQPVYRDDGDSGRPVRSCESLPCDTEQCVDLVRRKDCPQAGDIEAFQATCRSDECKVCGPAPGTCVVCIPSGGGSPAPAPAPRTPAPGRARPRLVTILIAVLVPVGAAIIAVVVWACLRGRAAAPRRRHRRGREKKWSL